MLSFWDNWGDERGCDEGYWHVQTRGLPCGIPEVVVTVQVHCSWRWLLWRGLEFHLCTINKSAHTKKSGNLFNDPRKFGSMVSPSSRVQFILLLHLFTTFTYVKSFCLHHHIIYTCHSVAYYQFLLWHNWFLWRLQLLLETIQFLSLNFLFAAIT